MKYCYECGHELEDRELEHEGMVPYCSKCAAYRFPIFNTAVSMVVLNPAQDKILLIQQYGRSSNILVAGYVNKGESAEEAVIRELKEEIGRDVIAYRFLKSSYFTPSNTLICNFVVVIDQESLDDVSDWEVDHAQWYTFEEAKTAVKQASLAQKFLFNFFRLYEKEPVFFFDH